MKTLKITRIGDAMGVILTEEIMAHMEVKEGDTLYLAETPTGTYRLGSGDPETVRKMALAEEIMHDDREVLRALAK